MFKYIVISIFATWLCYDLLTKGEEHLLNLSCTQKSLLNDQYYLRKIWSYCFIYVIAYSLY